MPRNNHPHQANFTQNLSVCSKFLCWLEIISINMDFDSFKKDFIDDVFDHEKIPDFTITLLTYVGLGVLILLALKIAISCIRLFRLYVFSQIIGGTDLIKKYGKWVVISGATDGIGLELAREFARRGHSIVVIGRNVDKLASTKATLEKIEKAGQIVVVKVDLSDSSLENFDRIRSLIDPDKRDIGIMVNNAGCFCDRFGFFSNFTMAEILTMLNVNVGAAVHLTHMVLPGMAKRKKGLILNISSGLGLAEVPYLAVYGTTKTFMNSMTERLNIECNRHGIDHIVVTPGPVDTKLYRQASNRTSSATIISADYLAKNVINALSTGITTFSGCLMHEFLSASLRLASCLGCMGLMSRILIKSFQADVDFEPKLPHVEEA